MEVGDMVKVRLFNWTENGDGEEERVRFGFDGVIEMGFGRI